MLSHLKRYHVSLTSNQIAQVGGVLKLSEPADSKTDPGFENSPRFEGVTEQKKIQPNYDHDCIRSCAEI